jgi:hypothetical protein
LYWLQEGVRLYATRVQQGVPVHPDYTSMVLWSCAVIQHMDWASLGTLFARWATIWLALLIMCSYK